MGFRDPSQARMQEEAYYFFFFLPCRKVRMLTWPVMDHHCSGWFGFRGWSFKKLAYRHSSVGKGLPGIDPTLLPCGFSCSSSFELGKTTRECVFVHGHVSRAGLLGRLHLLAWTIPSGGLDFEIFTRRWPNPSWAWLALPTAFPSPALMNKRWTLPTWPLCLSEIFISC